jgi:hypothetical protein
MRKLHTARGSEDFAEQRIVNDVARDAQSRNGRSGGAGQSWGGAGVRRTVTGRDAAFLDAQALVHTDGQRYVKGDKLDPTHVPPTAAIDERYLRPA